MATYKKNLKGDWNKEKTLLLIEKFKSYPELWKSSAKEYKNKTRKLRAIKLIADSLQIPELEVNRKLHNLRCQMNTEIRKLARQSRTNSDPAFPPKSYWEYFDALQFIKGQKDRTDESSVERLVPIMKNNVRPEVRPVSDTEESPNEVEPTISDTEESSREVALFEPIVELFDSASSEIEQSPTISNGNPFTYSKQNGIIQNNGALNCALAILDKSFDDSQIFGNFVASVLRNMRSEQNRAKLKRLIQMNILAVTEEDEFVNNNYDI